MVSHAINSTTSPTITTTTSTTTNNANDTDDYDEDDDGSSRAARAVFLALILAVACMSSVLLLHAAMRHRRSRHGAHSVLVLNLLLLSLGDALLDMPLVMGSLLAGTSWAFPDALCRTHAFFMSLVLMETGLGLAALALDSYLAVKYLERHDALLSPIRVGVMVGVTWLLSVCFSAPFLTEAVRLAFRPQLHTCSVAEETPLVFVCLASAVCFLAPALLMVVAFCLLRREGARQQQMVKVVVTQSQYTDELMEEPLLWREMARARYVGILCLLWFVLEVPYMIIIFIQQYRLSKELHFSVDYPWAVDVAFLWVRFSFSAVLPCVTLACKKELWQSCKKCLVCHRNNSVLDVKATADPSRVEVRKVPPSPKPPPRRDQAKANAPNSLLSFNVPVLFATSDGIHIETPHTDIGGQDERRTDGDRQPVLQGRQLDVAVPCAEEGGLAADASEYDSSSGTECSSPQILSARHIRGALAVTPPSTLPPLRAYQQRGAPDNEEDGDDNDNDRVTNGEGRDWSPEPHRTAVPANEHCDYREDPYPNSSDLADPTEVSNEGQTDLAPNSVPHATEERQRMSVSDSHSPSHNNPDNNNTSSNSSSSSSSVLGQTRPQHSTARVQGRLKPLPANKKKAEWPERKLFSGKDPAAPAGADYAKEKPGGKQTAVRVSVGKELGTADLSRPSKEGRKKGHKRTQTSDSAKALLGSNSSAEIATNAGVRGSDSDSANRQESF